MMLEKAMPEDAARIMEIIEEARRFQLSYGNMQWAGGYPSLSLIESDIAEGIGYKAVLDGSIIGYLAVVDFDETYGSIDGKWMSDGPYIAVHRIALSDSSRGKGLFPAIVEALDGVAAERGAMSIRMDTDSANPIMQHLLGKLGFVHTGYVMFEGSRKLAYERPVILQKGLPC